MGLRKGKSIHGGSVKEKVLLLIERMKGNRILLRKDRETIIFLISF